jgi:hypothetical protein
MKYLKDKIRGSRLDPIARFVLRKIRNDKYDAYSNNSNTTKILLACFPKSGSTFTSSVLSQLDGFRRVSLVPSYGRREQELDVRYLYKHRNIDFVAQHHVRYSIYLEEVLQKYNVKPIILVRNLYDSIVSVADHLRNESAIFPMAVISSEHAKLNDAQLYRVISDLVVPWYINFYVGWKTSPIKPLVVKYEDMIGNPEDYFQNIFNAAGINVTSKNLNDCISKAYNGQTRLNKGVAGRGDSLPSDVKEQVKRFTAHYPSVDFSDIGIK